jgi:hypothetical protein
MDALRFYKYASPTDFAAFAFFARQKIQTPIAPIIQPKLALVAVAGCWHPANLCRWGHALFGFRLMVNVTSQTKYRNGFNREIRRIRAPLAACFPIPTELNHSAQRCAPALRWVHVQNHSSTLKELNHFAVFIG